MDKLFNNNKIIILDGAMGTMLQREGMPVGALPEVYTFEHPEVVERIHRAYIEAGSNVIYANTFSANSHKLKNSGYTPTEIITKAIMSAKKVSNGKAKVALDVGPIGEMLEPTGTLSFENAYNCFKEILIAGESAGADFVVFETFTDLAEMRIAILAAKENTNLPIFSTMTFDESGRTFTGALAECFALTISGLGVDAIGINCSLGPKQIMPIIKRIAEVSEIPLIVKPNAGLPDAKDGHYNMTPKQFAMEMSECIDIGVKFVGGCCGTDPEYIKELTNIMSPNHCKTRHIEQQTQICSTTRVVKVDDVRIIGERINPTGKKRFQQALREGDTDYILAQGIAQMDAGAEILDVNVGVPGLCEKDLMEKYVRELQATCDLPLQIDSNNVEAIEAGLRVFCGRAIVNSINGEQDKLNKVLPLVKKYGACVVGLTMDENGIPKTAAERFKIAERILDACLSYGMPKENVFIDCLCLTVSASQDSAKETLKAVKMVKENLGLHTVLGVSNISFGLPNRDLINGTFLTLALENGLDLPILNPNKQNMTDAVYAYRLLKGLDIGCESFVERFGVSESKSTTSVVTSSGSIFDAISKGLKTEAKEITKHLLTQKTELEIINEMLIPSLDAVGIRYEKGEIFLPQLLRSANASSEAFEVIKLNIAKKGAPTVSKDKIILATVKGDIHDIGKNIVKTILSNYGYQMIDLGRDVDPKTIVSSAIENDVKLIGLSALMTTTLPSMADTIKELQNSGHDCKIFVGGAVLTPEYAKEISADFYAKDAKQSVDIAKKVLG